jgi:hypothetical protein
LTSLAGEISTANEMLSINKMRLAIISLGFIINGNTGLILLSKFVTLHGTGFTPSSHNYPLGVHHYHSRIHPENMHFKAG